MGNQRIMSRGLTVGNKERGQVRSRRGGQCGSLRTVV